MTGSGPRRSGSIAPTGTPAVAPALVPALAAALGYLAFALFALRAVVPAPASLLPYPAEAEKHGVLVLDRADQAFTVRTIAENARRLVTAPSTLFGFGQCFPMSQPQTLGEHLLGEGLLGAVPYALTRDPILTFNAVVLLSLLVPALAMYALAREWTGSGLAAFVAGLLFAFHPERLVAASKPFIAGNGWTPLVLLFVHRLIVRRRWRDALFLALLGSLQLLASFYQVLGAALLVGSYALVLCVGAALARRRGTAMQPAAARSAGRPTVPAPPGRALPSLLPKALVALAVLALVGWAVFAPYLHTREAWGVLGGRTPIFFYLRHFVAPHGPAYPGTIALVLALVGIADRARGPRPRPGEDPRVAVLVAGLFVVWCLSTGIPIPGTSVVVPSPLRIAAGWAPGLDAVRVLPLARFAWYLAVAALAAFGVAALAERIERLGGARARAVLAIGIVAGALLELAWPPLARRSFLAEPTVRAYLARPSDEEIALYRSVPAGAVLDLPLASESERGGLAAVPALRASAWHGRPIAACYNSFVTPLSREVEEMASNLTGPFGADRLAALGFRSLLVHDAALSPDVHARLDAWLRDGGKTTLLARASGVSLYGLGSDLPVVSELSALAAGLPFTPGDPIAGIVPYRPFEASGSLRRAAVPIYFRNGSSALYRHPDPIEPTRLRARWRSPSGEVAFEGEARGLLPIAIPPGGLEQRMIDVGHLPPPGEYAVEVATEAEPGRVIGSAEVSVRGRSPAAPGLADDGPSRAR
jgi:hypothetical protein